MNEEQYGEQLYQLLFDLVGNKKNNLLLESLRGENAVLTYLSKCALRSDKKAVHAGNIAEELSLVPGRMTDILKNLEKKGMLVRERDPFDKRKVLVQITEKGLDYVKNRREVVRQQYSSLYKELGTVDTIKLIELLNRVNQFFK